MEILKPHRDKIDAIDNELLALLGKRFEIVRTVAGIKGEHGIDPILPDRVEEVKARCAKIGETHGLDPQFIRDLYTVIIDHACSLEDNMIAKDKARQG